MGDNMPVYEYECPRCGDREDIIKKVKDIDREEECKKCEVPMLRICGNKGGFRLGEKGNVSWGKGGYNTHYGDIKNSEEGRKVF